MKIIVLIFLVIILILIEISVCIKNITPKPTYTKIIEIKKGESTEGFWQAKRKWKAHWVKHWETRTIWVPVWKKVWGPIEVKEWVPLPPPNPKWEPNHNGTWEMKPIPWTIPLQ